MSFFARFFLPAILVFVNLLPVSGQKPSQNILVRKYSPVQLREDATVMKNVILAMHPVIGIYRPRKFYEGLFDTYIQSIKDSMTEKQFRIKTKIILDDLHCGHTEAASSREYIKALDKQTYAYSPYFFIPLNNKLYMLASVNRKKDTLIKSGTEITRINGVSVDTILTVCEKMITTDGFNTTGKEHYIKLLFNSYYPALFGRPDSFTVEYKTSEKIKKVRYAAVKLKNIPPVPLTKNEDSLFTIYKRARMKYRFLDAGKKTMQLKITSFSRRRIKSSYRKIFKKLEKNNTENLVIDLRNNGGGSLENSYRLLSYLVNEKEPQTLKTGIRNYPYRKYTSGNIWFKTMKLAFRIIGKKATVNDTDYFTYKIKPRKHHHFDKKVYVLINGGSFSASCLVSAYLKYNGRATFVGEETSGAMEGCNAGITPYYKLPNTKIKIRMPAFRIQHDVCPQITGHGIMPDYEIKYSIRDVLARKDLEIEKIKELLGIK